jgi:dipeptidyl aminopeptidase/acylaminoacyl peptidase
VTLLEEVKFNLNILIEKEIAEFLTTIKKETIALDNGAEGHFVFSEKFKGEKRPMVTIIHGGPFGCAPQDMFLQMRTFLLLQGYSLLILNYTGSTSYGEDFLNNLLGAIGDKDVHDCGQLIKKAIN